MLLDQHDKLSRTIQYIYNQQPSFKTFQQQQLAAALSDQLNLNPESLILKRWLKLGDGSIRALSSEPLLDALGKKVGDLLSNPGKSAGDNSNVQSGIFTQATADHPSTLVESAHSLDNIAQRIATQYPATLQAHWTTPTATEIPQGGLKAPQDQLLTLHKEQLSTLAALRASDGTLNPASKRLIDTALQYPTLAERESAFANGTRPGVYPITVDDGTERGALLAGAFLITATDNSWSSSPAWPKGRTLTLNDSNGPVVMYTPGEGFEEFATPAQARQALAQRLDAGGANADLLLQQLPLSVQKRVPPLAGEDLMLSVEPLTGDVLAEGIPWMLKRQQAEVTAGMAQTSGRSGANPLSDPAALQTLDAAADWSYLLDGSNAMLARNEKLGEKNQPDWLKSLSPAQLALFARFEQAQEKNTEKLLPLLEKIPALGSFSRDRMNEAIKKLYPTAHVNADQLMVKVQTKTSIHIGRPSQHQTPYGDTKRVSLTDLALRNPTEFEAASSSKFTLTTLTLPLTDTQGKPILGADGKQVVLDTDQIKTLINNADVGGEYTKRLKQELATDAESGTAGDIRSAWKTSQADQMEKDAFLAQLNPDAYTADATNDKTTKRGAQWVTAVLDHPDPSERPQVDGKTIVANSLLHRSVPVQGVMVIGNPVDKALVLYTPEAPDGVAFREVADQQALNTLLEKKEWKLYVAGRKSPVTKDDVAKAKEATTEYVSSLGRDHGAGIDSLIKTLKLSGGSTALAPITGNPLDELYKQQVQQLIDKADYQSVSSAEVAIQSRTNMAQFGIEVAMNLLDLIPLAARGLSFGMRLGKAAVTALRTNASVLPKLIRSPGLARGIYTDFALSAAGIPLIRTAPLRPVFKAPTVSARQPTTGLSRSGNVPPPAPSIPGTSAPRLRIIEPNATLPTPNRDMSAYTVPDDVIRGQVLRSDNTYKVGDIHYVRYTDNTGVNKVYQIDSNFHARNGQVNIVDPNAPLTAVDRQIAKLQLAGNGEWRLSELPGGRRHRGRVPPPANDTYMDRILSGAAARDIDGSAATTGQVRRWFRRDMDSFYNDLATNGMPAQPSLPVMSINSTPELVIQTTLSQPGVRGLVVGELHHEPAAYQLVIDQMQEFKNNGVTTIYVEGAPFLQGSPNIVDAQLLPSDAPHFGQHPYHPDFTGGPTLVDIINAADKHGIQVIGLEHPQLTWHVDNLANKSITAHARGVEDRLKEFNYHAAKIIERTPTGEKFVAIVGKSHMNTDYGVPGIAELTGGVGMSVSPSPKGASSLASQPQQSPQLLKLMRGTSQPELYGDIHVEYNIDALTV